MTLGQELFVSVFVVLLSIIALFVIAIWVAIFKPESKIEEGENMEEKFKASFNVNRNTGQQSILIKYIDSGYEKNLWKNIVAHCLKDFSNNQLKDIYQQILVEYNSKNKEDITPNETELFNDLKKELCNRCNFKCPKEQSC